MVTTSLGKMTLDTRRATLYALTLEKWLSHVCNGITIFLNIK